MFVQDENDLHEYKTAKYIRMENRNSSTKFLLASDIGVIDEFIVTQQGDRIGYSDNDFSCLSNGSGISLVIQLVGGVNNPTEIRIIEDDFDSQRFYLKAKVEKIVVTKFKELVYVLKETDYN